MVTKFVDHFARISPLSETERKAIADGCLIQSFKKGSFLLKEGQVSTSTYFVLEGCIREYISTEGDEKTFNFYTEDQWVISLNEFTQQGPSMHNLVCTEDSTVAMGNEELAQEMFKSFPRFETIARAVMEAYFNEQKNLLTSFVLDSPEQRYAKLLKTKPELIQRVPQYQLASYLGITPESLSRIRKRMMEKPE